MKSEFLKVMKKVAVSALALSIVAVGSVGMPNAVKAAEDTKEVKYVEFDNIDPADYIGKKAPECTLEGNDGAGYLFAGWYEQTGDNTYSPIENETDLGDATGAVVAKFVPAQVLSVKCQNQVGTTAEMEGLANVRVISALDSKNYASYGFEFTRANGAAWVDLGTYEPETLEVYSTFNYYEKNGEENVLIDSYEPSDLFGADAGHFTTCALEEIPRAAHGTIICIKPYWTTLDGVKVYGLSKFAHVEDGYLNYVNVPVNVNAVNAAAGMLNVESANGLEFVGVEYGKLFDEMDSNVVTSDDKVIVKCVGNTSDASDKNGMDIYVNVRFKDTNTSAISKYAFTVTNEEFCDSAKTISTPDVWNVKY